MNWKEFRSAVRKYGFIEIDQYNFSVPDSQKSSVHVTAAHRAKKLLLTADLDIRTGEPADTARVYGALAFSGPEQAVRAQARYGLSAHSDIDHGSPLLFDMKIDRNLIAHLRTMGEEFSFVDWRHPRGHTMRPCLATYASHSLDVYSILVANDRELELFMFIAPDWVRDFIGCTR